MVGAKSRQKRVRVRNRSRHKEHMIYDIYHVIYILGNE